MTGRGLEKLMEAGRCEAQGDSAGELKALMEGLQADGSSYEMFYMLGLLYRNRNLNQAYLCMRQAEWYCAQQKAGDPELEKDLQEIGDMRRSLEQRPDLSVRGLSVVILSYNDAELMKACLASVRREMDPRDTQIVVTENASTDGIAAWLRTQDGILLIENGDNVGYPVGCNIGVMACNPGNDLLLLNNDTELTPNAAFWLRMGLYEERNVGAAGPVSNHATAQTVAERPVLSAPATEERTRLTGFALMVKREAADAVMEENGLLFDPRFAPAYFEDDDLGMRIARAGFRQLLCHNSYVLHEGGKGFGKASAEAVSGISPVMQRSREKFCEKWGFDIWAYELPWEEALEKIEAAVPDHRTPLRILQIGCGMGATLATLKYRYPNSYAAGIEGRDDVAGIGRFMADIISGNAETMLLPYPPHSFDVILLADAPEHVQDPEAFGERMRELLKEDGLQLII